MGRIQPQTRALSVRQLTLIFFGAVGLCAIFFALGFLIGANRRTPPAGPVVEQVPPPSEIPAPINAPLQDSQAGGATTGSHPKSQTATVIEQNLPAARPDAARAASVGNGRAAGPKTPQTRQPPAQPGVAMVQVAALRAKSDAQLLQHELKSHGYHAVIVSPDQAGAGDHLYRVQVGPFTSRAQAVRSMNRLSHQGFKAFIKE